MNQVAAWAGGHFIGSWMRQAMEYEIREAESDGDYEGIVALQRANLAESVDAAERREQGFVTLRHDVALLREMGARWAHTVAVVEGTGEVAGYALVMLASFRERFAVLGPMFERLDVLSRAGGPLAGRAYYVMGQVCVAKAHRGRELVGRMYAAQRRQMRAGFDVMVTVIDAANTRSIRAHEKAGVVEVDRYGGGDGREWVIVWMELRGEAD